MNPLRIAMHHAWSKIVSKPTKTVLLKYLHQHRENWGNHVVSQGPLSGLQLDNGTTHRAFKQLSQEGSNMQIQLSHPKEKRQQSVLTSIAAVEKLCLKMRCFLKTQKSSTFTFLVSQTSIGCMSPITRGATSTSFYGCQVQYFPFSNLLWQIFENFSKGGILSMYA